MNASRRFELFIGFDLCKAVNARGRVRPGSGCEALFDLPYGFTPPAGSFIVMVCPENEHLCFGEEWDAHDREFAVFEPFTGELAPGETYLWGYYDPFHRWLSSAYVQRFAQAVGNNLVFMDCDGEPDLEDAVKKSEAVIVGHLVGIVRGDPAGHRTLVSNPFKKISKIPIARATTKGELAIVERAAA